MDPDVTWQTLCASLHVLQKNPEDTEAREQATECLSVLYNWLDRGGFPPDVRTHAAKTVVHEVLNHPLFKGDK